jgi:hypothetical protein
VEPHLGKAVVAEEEDPTAMEALLDEFEA